VSHDDGELFEEVMEKKPSPFEEDSPQWLLREQQKEQAKKNKPKRVTSVQ